MIIKRLRSAMERMEYQKLSIDINGMYLYFLINNHKVSVIFLTDYSHGDEIKKDIYADAIDRVKQTFHSKGYPEVESFHIFCTYNPQSVKEVCTVVKDFYIVDMMDNRLVIFENQGIERLGIRKLVEEVLEGNTVGKGFSICTIGIIAINILLFLIVEITGSSENTEHMLSWGAMYWPFVSKHHQYYRLFTHMFLHFGVNHIFNNMFVLAFIGSKLEVLVGKWKFLFIYFVSGVIAGLASMVYNMINGVLVVSAGASGAVFGVVGAIFSIVAINKGRVPNITTSQLILFLGLSLYGGFSSEQVDNIAHIGGLVAGAVLGMLCYWKINVKGSDKYL